jgi:hypothetical protein
VDPEHNGGEAAPEPSEPDKTTKPAAPPTEPGPKIVDISAGLHEFCVLLDDGSIQCGDSSLREEGWRPKLGELDFRLPKDRRALLGEGPTAPTRLALSEFDICAIRADASVVCWQSGRETQPLAGLVGETPTQIDAGRAHTCARLDSGRVACWGQNGEGQVGDGTRELRREAVLVSGLEDAVEIATGSHHSCARHRDGGVSCWGSNDHGQLGRKGGARTRPARVPGVEGATAIASGLAARQTCAITDGGGVACWGSWGMKRWEVGARRLTPVPLVLEGAAGVEELVVNVYQICARRDEQVSCWERDDSDTRGAPVYAPPVAAFEGTPVSRLASGAFRIYARISDTSVVVRNRSLGSLEPLGTFTVDGVVAAE